MISRLRTELKVHQCKVFTCNQSKKRVNSKYFRWILNHLVIDWSITCVHDFQCLIFWFAWTTWREYHILHWKELHYWDKWLTSRIKLIPNASEVKSKFWTNFFVHRLFEFWWFWCSCNLAFCHHYILRISTYFSISHLSLISIQ